MRENCYDYDPEVEKELKATRKVPTDAELLDWIEDHGGVLIDIWVTKPQWQVREHDRPGTKFYYGEILGEGDTLREALTKAMEAHPNE